MSSSSPPVYGSLCRLLLPLGGALATLAAGCAAVPEGAPAGNQFDGVYAGDNQLVRGFGFVCGPPGYPQSLTVHDGRFDYPFAVAAPLTGPVPVQITADGSLYGQMRYGTYDYLPLSDYRTEWVAVSGRITGPTLDATVVDMRCTRHLTLQRR